MQLQVDDALKLQRAQLQEELRVQFDVLDDVPLKIHMGTPMAGRAGA